jgi:hypothetical protein
LSIQHCPEEIMYQKKSLVAGIVFAGLLSAGLAMGQEVRKPGPPVACPHPVTITISAGSAAPTPDLSQFPAGTSVAGSVWNQTMANKHFGHTFHFPAPPKECCVMTSGTLRVTLKALQTGSKGSSSSANDGVNIFSGGVSVMGQTPWPNGAVAGATTTLSFTIPASVLATGEVNLYVQDDEAVVSATLVLTGCCLK